MKFVYPEFLWAFGVLIIPIIIHLFNFRKYKILYFSSLKFLNFVDQQTRSTQKLKHLLVLISRILAFSLIVIAFAQPYIPFTNSQSNGGKPVLGIYIDNSFSMSMKGTEGELLSEAREMARKMISESPLDTRFILVTNQMSGIEQRIVSKLDALERLDKIKTCPISRSIPEIIDWEKTIIEKENETNQKIGHRKFVIFSDFQKNSSDFSKLKADAISYYYPVKLKAEDESNILIDSVWFTSPIQKIGQTNELNIRVKNISDENLTNVELHVEIENIERDIFIDIQANQTVSTSVSYSDKKEGFKKGVVRVNDKQLYFDDEYFFSYEVIKNSSILIINGDNAVKNISLVYSLDNFYVVEEINQNNFRSDYLVKKDLVVLNGIKEISSGLSEELSEFSKNGGALALFPGEEIDNFKSGWNPFLSKLKMPTFKGVLNEGLKIKNINFEDPFFNSIFEKKPDNLNLPSILKAYKLNTSFNAKAVGLINLQNGSPLYLRSTGESTIFLFTSSLIPSYSNFISNALFSAIILRTAELSFRKTPLFLILGEDTKFPIYSKSKSESPIHIKNKSVDFIPATFQKGSISYFSLNGLEVLENLKSDTYDIFDDAKIGNVSINYSRKESDIRSFTLSEISSIFETQGIKHINLSEISEGNSLSNIDLTKPYEYWKLFLSLALIFLLLEIVILKFWKR